MIHDNFINFYFRMVEVRNNNKDVKVKSWATVYAFQSLFWDKLINDGYAAAKKWIKFNPLDYDLILLPIHLPAGVGHWVLLVVGVY